MDVLRIHLEFNGLAWSDDEYRVFRKPSDLSHDIQADSVRARILIFIAEFRWYLANYGGSIQKHVEGLGNGDVDLIGPVRH